jgi:hypothetical protein
LALQTITGGLWIPAPIPGFAGSLQHSTAATIDASTELCAGVFTVPKAGAIRTVEFRTGAVSVNAASRLNVRIETVSTTDGNPTGSAYGGMTTGTAGAAPVANSWNSITLGTDATVVAVGDTIAAVVGYGTFTAADSVVVSCVNSGNSASLNFPYVDAFVGGAWAKSSTMVPCMAIGYSDGSYEYIQGVMPILTFSSQTYASNTAGSDEYGLSFQVPFPTRLRGAIIDLDADGDCEVILYTGTSATETITIDKDQRSSAIRRYQYFRFPTGPTIAANTTYRLAVRPTTTTSVVLGTFIVNAAGLFDQMGGGQNFRLASRLDQGAWAADTTTQRPNICLEFDQFDDGVSTGSMVMSRVRTGF